jgi:hypothetical protein
MNTKFGQNLYKQARDNWYKEKNATYRLGINYNISRFDLYKERRLLRSPYNDISYWANRPYDEFNKFIHGMDKVFNALEEVKNKKNDVEILLKNEMVTVLIPNTREACRKYGSGTSWCVTDSTTFTWWLFYCTGKRRSIFILPKGSDEKYVAYMEDNVAFDITDKENYGIGKEALETICKKWKIPLELFMYKRCIKSWFFVLRRRVAYGYTQLYIKYIKRKKL